MYIGGEGFNLLHCKVQEKENGRRNIGLIINKLLLLCLQCYFRIFIKSIILIEATDFL